MHAPDSSHLGLQALWLFLLALPIATVSWTITHEEILREPREWLQRTADRGRTLLARKLAFMLTCEYCLSHYVGLAFVALTGFRLLLDDWRGYVLSFFALPWIANIYMSAFGRLRLDIKRERVEIEEKEEEVEQMKDEKRAAWPSVLAISGPSPSRRRTCGASR